MKFLFVPADTKQDMNAINHCALWVGTRAYQRPIQRELFNRGAELSAKVGAWVIPNYQAGLVRSQLQGIVCEPPTQIQKNQLFAEAIATALFFGANALAAIFMDGALLPAAICSGVVLSHQAFRIAAPGLPLENKLPEELNHRRFMFAHAFHSDHPKQDTMNKLLMAGLPIVYYSALTHMDKLTVIDAIALGLMAGGIFGNGIECITKQGATDYLCLNYNMKSIKRHKIGTNVPDIAMTTAFPYIFVRIVIALITNYL